MLVRGEPRDNDSGPGSARASRLYPGHCVEDLAAFSLNEEGHQTRCRHISPPL